MKEEGGGGGGDGGSTFVISSYRGGGEIYFMEGIYRPHSSVLLHINLIYREGNIVHTD